MVESEIRSEHLPRTLAIVRRVITFLEISTKISPKSNVWYKMAPIGGNILAKQMQSTASIASLDGKFTNSSGRKTVIQALRDDFDPLEISALTGHANPESISSDSHNPLEKQRRMSNKLAGINPSTTTTNSHSSHALREIGLNSSAPPSNTAATSNRDSSASRSSYLMAGAVGEMFTGVTFHDSPVNISINFQSNMTPTSDSAMKEKRVEMVTFKLF